MARKALIEKEKKRQKLVDLKADKRAALKKIVKDLYTPIEEKIKAQEALNKLPKNSSPIRLRNRCSITGRARGYLRKFRLSRITFREMAHKGLIPGVTTSSW
ncbi:30S ribosomal protein S14 [Candidatus Aerophobetes bacterium]|uniref:Small ribosomal subunit protein uS14 n=1 Tax=Aerophobetes bacterium TaxID=2030807 RepID=A0A2A4X7D3_UNCAE|nr:MAG: 30S ribosomal protein S14 [Candidatus Aerophobetes bacterium]